MDFVLRWMNINNKHKFFFVADWTLLSDSVQFYAMTIFIQIITLATMILRSKLSSKNNFDKWICFFFLYLFQYCMQYIQSPTWEWSAHFICNQSSKHVTEAHLIDFNHPFLREWSTNQPSRRAVDRSKLS